MNIQEQYNDALENSRNDPYIQIEPWGRNIHQIRLTIRGLNDTPYEEGSFVFEIKIDEDSY